MTIFDLWPLLVYYVPSFIGCVVIAGSIGFILPRAQRKFEKNWRAGVAFSLALVPILMWLVYFCATVNETYVLNSLDAENDLFAERIYYTRFNVDLKTAVSIATDENEPGNVRFYASCRIADLISINNESVKAEVLKRTSGPLSFRTDFFNTNRLTSGFFVPCHEEGPFTVNEIIKKRLEILAR
jgi:hypothetical protein